MLRESEFDIVLSDLNLPDSDGVETIEELRKASDQLPIIALTGHDGDIGLAAIQSRGKTILSRRGISASQSFHALSNIRLNAFE